MTDGTFSPASALVGDPSAFGRVAEDGVVYVKLPEGERAVGSYPGKTPEEALAYLFANLKHLLLKLPYLLLVSRVARLFLPTRWKQSQNFVTKSPH